MNVSVTSQQITASVSQSGVVASVQSGGITATATGGFGPPGPAGSAGSLSSLSDVQVVSVAEGDVLRYSSAAWRNAAETVITDGGNFLIFLAIFLGT
ncbi:hypothetical protein EB077_10540 [bacterium]|nr:hypothetical protein [bacterium]